MTNDPVRKRMLQMRWAAKYNGKTVPSIAELEAMIPKDIVCPECKRKMNWFRKEGHSTVITLQHDRDGKHRILCQGCNVRHAFMRRDDFYKFPKDKKRCYVCGTVKPLTEFWTDNSTRWMNKFGKCKPCGNKKHQEWVARNREVYNARKRAYYHKRKNSGNPIPR